MILSDNVNRLIFSCFPQTVTVCILPYPPPTLTERRCKCFQKLPKATETQKYLSLLRLRICYRSISITNPSRSSRLRRWLPPSGSENLEISIYTTPFCQGELRANPYFYLKNPNFTLAINACYKYSICKEVSNKTDKAPAVFCNQLFAIS